MAGDGSGTGPSEPPKEASSSVIIRAIPLSFRDEKEKEAFWQAYAAYVDQVTPKPSTAGTPATTQPKTAFDYESLIKDKFPVALKEGFKSFLSVPYGAETRTRQRALIALRFSVKEISYGPIGIETTIENHDWMSAHTAALTASNGTIICNIGGGNVAKNYYKVSSYAHDKSTVGKFKKALLHRSDEEERAEKSE